MVVLLLQQKSFNGPSAKVLWVGRQEVGPVARRERRPLSELTRIKRATRLTLAPGSLVLDGGGICLLTQVNHEQCHESTDRRGVVHSGG